MAATVREIGSWQFRAAAAECDAPTMSWRADLLTEKIQLLRRV